MDGPQRKPDIRLLGDVDDDMVRSFLDQLEAALDKDVKDVLLELSTLGGEADAGIRISEELRLAQDLKTVRCTFIGKGTVYSAGATIMAAIPRERRYLTQKTRLLIHSRKLKKDINLDGPLPSCKQVLQQVMSELDEGMRVQEEGFEQLIQGSNVTIEELNELANRGWYVTADEALQRGLIAGVL